jgi:hypothetical protein
MPDLMTRLVFDLYATTVFGVDPARLSPDDMPPVHVADAMDTVMEVGLFRHLVPAFCWRVELIITPPVQLPLLIYPFLGLPHF